MTLEQRTRMAILYDLYSGLLTEKQKNVFDLYYQCDLSLGEIAAEQQTSRTAVFDLVTRTEQLLEKYEAGLHLAARDKKRTEVLEQLYSLAAGNEEMLALLRKLSMDGEE